MKIFVVKTGKDWENFGAGTLIAKSFIHFSQLELLKFGLNPVMKSKVANN